MKKKLRLVLAIVISIIMLAGTIWGVKVDPGNTFLQPPLPRGDESPDYLITRTPGVLWDAFCEEDTIVSPYDTVIGCTYYEWQAACRMPRMIANDYQDITAGGHGLHFTFMHQDIWGTNAKRYVTYAYWDADNDWDSLPAPLITRQGYRAGFTGLDLFRPLDGYFKPHSRAVVCYHTTEGVFPNTDDIGVVLSIEPNAPGDTSMWGGQYWYDIPDSANTAFKGMFPECAVDSLNRIHIVMNEGDTSPGPIWMAYIRCEERSGDKLMCWAPGKDSVILDKEIQYFDPLNNQVAVFGTSGVESHSVVSSKVSNKVAIFYPGLAESETDSGLYQIANDIYYFESTSGGDDWFTAGSMPERINITKYQPEDKLRAYGAVSAVYDMNDSLHIFWHTHYYDQDLQEIDILNVSLWHWSKATARVCNGDTLPANEIAHAEWLASSGAWNRLLDKVQCGVGYDPGLDNYNYLYLIWVQFDSGKTNQAGNMTQGDIYMSVSTDGGLIWHEPMNLTSSTVPDCAPGDCASDHWPSIAERVDTATYLSWVYDLDAGAAVQDEGGPANSPILFYHYPVDSFPLVGIVRIDWNPREFVNPPVHLPLNGIDTLFMTIENIGTKTLNVTSISSGASWLGINPASTTIPPGGCPTNIELIITGGSQETFLVDSIRIQSNDESGNNDVYIRVHVVVSDVYLEPEFAVLSNPKYRISLSNTGNLGHQDDTAGFFMLDDVNQPNLLKDGSPILVYVSPTNDTLVQRYIYDEHYLWPATDLSVDTFPLLKTIVTDAEFWPVRIQIPPADQDWPWWKIRIKNLIFYKGEYMGDEKFFLLKTIQLFHDPPPPWWVDLIPPSTIPETYLGMVLDVDCPSDSDSWNYPYADSTRRSAYLQGYGGGSNQDYSMGIAQRDPCYEFAPDSFACWPDPKTLFSLDRPYAMHILRNDAFVYPQNGFRDDSLYTYMTDSGYSIYGSGDPADYNILTTGKVIPAHAYPTTDTHTVTYALITSDYGSGGVSWLADMVLCGNANRDDEANITDVVWLAGWVFAKGRPDPWVYMSDVNGSGAVDVTDLVYYVNYLFKSGPPPRCDCLR
jgi:hypothetical protein